MALINRVASLCLVSVLLSACGGGGGGGSSPPPSSTTPPPSTTTPPPATPPPFALTEANAVQAAVYALAPLEQMLSAGQFAVSATNYFLNTRLPQYTITCATTPPVTFAVTYADRDNSGIPSVGDVIDVPAVDCAGFTRKVTFTLTDVGATKAGRVELDVQVSPTGMHIVGTFDVSYVATVPGESTLRITNALATVTDASTTQTVRLASGQFSSMLTTYAVNLTGGNVDSGYLAGSYDFATTTPFAGFSRRLPSAGELTLTAPAGSRARVAPPATPSNVEEAVEYAVAATAGGAFAATQQTVWTAILRGSLFGWRPNVAPTLTNLQIQPPNPAPGASLYLTYLAFDSNNDPLTTTIEWQRNGTVVGGNEQWLYVPTVRDDTISVTVTVSDGRLTTSATANVKIINPPPTLSLTLTPQNPDTAVDLVAVATIVDPDGEPLTTTYEWTRGGTAIAGQTGATLPASETTRGDVIAVRVRVSDGTTTVEKTATTTIVDSPPRLSVLSPPTTVAHGAPVSFTATVTDADGDPVDQLDFVLAYGPAGMTVNADTGAVSWTASGPMFDREMNVNWGITVTGPTAQLATGTLKVTDSSRDYPLLRFGTQIPTWPAGLSVGDFDADGDTEMLVMGRRWLFELAYDGAGGYRQSWAYPFPLNIDPQYSSPANRNSMATGDVDGDGKQEIFVSVGPTLTKIDGADRRVVATRRFSGSDVCADLQYADLENDGAPDLVCLATTDYWTATARILVLRTTDFSTRYEFPQANYGRSLALGNVDTDAALEIVTAAGYVFDGATFANQWLYSPGFGLDVDTGDLDGNGVEEIVAAADWYAVTGFSATLKTPLWEVQRSDLDSLLVADIAGDARPEIVVGDGQTGHLAIYRYNTATSGVDLIGEIGWPASGVTAIGVGDVDSDGERELIWGSGESSSGADMLIVAGLDPTLEIEWRNDDPIQLDGPFRGGELAGSPLASRTPLFVSLQTNSGYDGSRLVRMPADGTALEVSDLIDTNWAGSGAIDVVDYDDDLTDEVFIATNSYYDGLFRAYDFFGATNEWSSPALPNHTSSQDVTHADLTDDGKDDLIGITTSGVIFAFDVFQQTLFWQSTTLNGGRRVFAANMDGDANDELEIVAVSTRYVYVYERNASPGTPYIQTAIYQTNRDILDADVGDTDGDGDLEVVLLTGYAYSSTPSDIITLSSSLQSVGSFTLPWSAQTLIIEPAPPTSRKNLVVSRLVGVVNDSTIAIIDARSGSTVFESPPLIGTVQPNSVHYVTLPGETQPRMSIGTTGGMYLTR